MTLSMVFCIFLLLLPAFRAEAQHFRGDTLSVAIYFRQSHADLDLDYMGNREALHQFVHAYNSHPHKTTNIHVIGYASPEGTVRINQQLSQKRTAVVTDYLKTQCHITADSIVSDAIGVDWTDLYAAVQADANVPAREEVLDILTNIPDVVRDANGSLICQRNNLLKLLKNGRTWNYLLKNLYPYLRGAKAELICIVENTPTPEAETSAQTDSLLQKETPVNAEIADNQQITPPYSLNDDSGIAEGTSLSDPSLRYPIAAVRSNLLLPLLNVGVEVPVNRHWSIGADYYYPWVWPASNNKNCFELTFFSAEARYWFHAARNPQLPHKNYLLGSSVAPYLAWGYYDFEHNYHGHQGHFWSAGVDYVYAVPILKGRLHLEFQVAIGAIWSHGAKPYNVYEEGGHLIREKGQLKNYNYVGPTKVGISIVLPITRTVKPSHSTAL